MANLYQLKKKSERSVPIRETAQGEARVIDFREELNDQQYAAVTSPPGQALVLAGAGSGKTRTLTYRVAYLLQNAVAAENILLLTFTNKSAREMLERVEALLPGQTGGLWSGTFHSVCNRILRRNAEAAGLTGNFTILDAEDAKSLLTKVIKDNKELTERVERATGAKFPKAPVISGIISYAINTKKLLADVVREKFSPDEAVLTAVEKIAKLYDKKKREANALDFDDMLTRVLEMFTTTPKVLERYQYQFQFILVDEYQDTNPVQSDLINALAGQHGNVMVVGDDAQSIYSWRGADFQNIISFPQRFAGAQVYKVETNYRSTPEILEVANAAIKLNQRQYEKKLTAHCAKGMKPVRAAFYDPREQAAFVTQRIQELHEQGMPYEQMAVLYRAHFQSMELQLALTSERVPFIITSGLKFFEQAHIKDFTAYLRWVLNPRDESAFDRIAQMLPGVGAGSASKMWQAWLASEPAISGKAPVTWSYHLEKIKVPSRTATDWAQLGHTLDEFMLPDGTLQKPAVIMISLWEGICEDYVKASFDNAESRAQDVQQFIRYGASFEDLATLMSELALLSGPESAEETHNKTKKNPESVVLSSVHQAKGLEWKVVFVIWLTDGMFPNMRVIENDLEDGLEEERRLFYVSVTRAREQLYLLHPQTWPKSYNGEVYQIPSRFLEKLPKGLLDEWRMR